MPHGTRLHSQEVPELLNDSMNVRKEQTVLHIKSSCSQNLVRELHMQEPSWEALGEGSGKGKEEREGWSWELGLDFMLKSARGKG